MTEFSIPMMISKSLIYESLAINEMLKEQESEMEVDRKRRITSVFVALSQHSKDALGYENYRDHSYLMDKHGISYIDSLDKIIEAAKIYNENNIAVQYCLNSTKELTADRLYALRPKIFKLCDSLLEGGISHLKVSNLLLYDFISNYYEDAFTYYLSTTKEYSSIRQYEQLFDFSRHIKEVCLPTDLNRDYLFITNFIKKFKDKVNLEIMVNEGCIYGCPWRLNHTPHSAHSNQDEVLKSISNGFIDVTNRIINYYTTSCNACRFPYVEEEYFLRRTVMPFQLPVLEKWGVNKFKFAGRDMQTAYLFDSLKCYMLGIADPSYYLDKRWDWFNNYSYNYKLKDFKIRDVLELYPDYTMFESIGSNCHALCGVGCTYCRDLAKQLAEKRRKKK